ncbi:MAG: ATP-binding protein [Nitrospiraceae bacterium]
MSKPRALVSWSSGKDSAFAVHELWKQDNIEIVGLLSTVTQTYERVAMHGVRVALLKRQAEELGLPLHQVEIPYPCPNQIYERRMAEAIERAQRAHVTHIVFGDLFLEDVRRYRETMLAQTGIQPLFPLWQRPTRELANAMITSGLKAVITCVDPQRLSPSFAGKDYDATFLANLPGGVDPCGERGEFHTFVFDGPMMGNPIQIDIGETVERDGFVFADVLPKLRV